MSLQLLLSERQYVGTVHTVLTADRRIRPPCCSEPALKMRPSQFLSPAFRSIHVFH